MLCHPAIAIEIAPLGKADRDRRACRLLPVPPPLSRPAVRWHRMCDLVVERRRRTHLAYRIRFGAMGSRSARRSGCHAWRLPRAPDRVMARPPQAQDRWRRMDRPVGALFAVAQLGLAARFQLTKHADWSRGAQSFAEAILRSGHAGESVQR